MIDPRYPPRAGENEFGLVVTAEPTLQGNRKIGLRRMRDLIVKLGVVRTTRVKVLRKGPAGWGFYFHGFKSPSVWRSHG